MVDTEVLCRKHLLGEHVETHMFLGTLKRKMQIYGYIKNNLLEPISLWDRHAALVKEMRIRGMNHRSPLGEADIEYLPAEVLYYQVDVESSLEDLLSRCPECTKRYQELQNKKEM